MANVLKSKGVKRGDRVSIFMPMVPQLPIAMLACARIGAVHSVVFGGFSAEALAGRLIDSKSTVVITANGVMRGTKPSTQRPWTRARRRVVFRLPPSVTVRRVPHALCSRALWHRRRGGEDL
jgi:acyl-coenzyme A synthetase/AMP-(fatty) acid ligase